MTSKRAICMHRLPIKFMLVAFPNHIVKAYVHVVVRIYVDRPYKFISWLCTCTMCK